MVGYGQWTVALPQAGLVCLWSLKNLHQPVWSFSVVCGATALAASARSGSLLAVGLHDGSLQLHELSHRQVRCPP